MTASSLVSMLGRERDGDLRRVLLAAGFVAVLDALVAAGRPAPTAKAAA